MIDSEAFDSFISSPIPSIQAIFDKALNMLGHQTPKPDDVEKLAKLYTIASTSRGHGRGGKGNISRQRQAARRRKRGVESKQANAAPFCAGRTNNLSPPRGVRPTQSRNTSLRKQQARSLKDSNR